MRMLRKIMDQSIYIVENALSGIRFCVVDISTVETKLCDPDVNSQAGYFKISGSKDKNCTSILRARRMGLARCNGSQREKTRNS